MNNIPIIFIIICWVFYLLYWAVSSFSQKSVSEKPKSLRFVVVVLVSGISFMLLLVPGYFNLSAILINKSWLLEITSMLICASGLAVCIWARINLAGNWSNTLDFKKDHELIRNGPYRFIRHPIYAGQLLTFTGVALALGKIGGIIGIVIFLVSCLLRIGLEEDLMMKHFPVEYCEYKKKTKALVPYLW